MWTATGNGTKKGKIFPYFFYLIDDIFFFSPVFVHSKWLLWVTFTHTFTHKHSHKYSKHIQLVPRKKRKKNLRSRIYKGNQRARVRVSGSICGRMRDYEATTVRFMIWLCCTMGEGMFKYMLFFAIIIRTLLIKAAVSSNLIGLAFNFSKLFSLIVCHGKIIIKIKKQELF